VQEQANFWGCEGILPEFPQSVPKNFCAPNPTNVSLKKALHVCIPLNRGCTVLPDTKQNYKIVVGVASKKGLQFISSGANVLKKNGKRRRNSSFSLIC